MCNTEYIYCRNFNLLVVKPTLPKELSIKLKSCNEKVKAVSSSIGLHYRRPWTATEGLKGQQIELRVRNLIDVNKISFELSARSDDRL